MIEYNILNLKRRKDRYYAVAGHLQTLCVPFSQVRFHKGIDGKDYSSQDEACDEAIADGFKGFNSFRSSGIGTICGTWSALRVLRNIASDKYSFEFAYFNYDDKLLRLTTKEMLFLMKRISRECKIDKTPFLIFQLSPDNASNKNPISPDSFICKGIHSNGDSGLILSRDGSQLLLDEFEKKPQMLQNLLGQIDPSLPGTFSVRTNTDLILNMDYRFFGKSSHDEDQDRIILDRS